MVQPRSLTGRQRLNPNEIAFSQASISPATRDGIPLDDLVEAMRTGGWKGDPINVVRMSDGALTSMDIRRLIAARRAGIDAEVMIREFETPLPNRKARQNYSKKGIGDARSWGDAVTIRNQNQVNMRGGGASWVQNNPLGSMQRPIITGN